MLTALPETIELTDFTAGVVPRAEEVGVPHHAFLDAVNLLLEKVTGSVVTRKGTARIPAVDGTALDGYRLLSLNPYSRGQGNEYLICVYSSGAAAANNIKIYAYVLNDPEGLHGLDGDFFRIDTPGRVWASANGRHWGASIDGTYYGGGEGEKMYSWNPNRPTRWDADPGTPDYPTWRESGAANLDVNRNRDYAFKLNDGVIHSYTKDGTPYTEAFQAAKDLRHDKWDSSVKKYRKGDKVSTTYDIDGNGAYWRTWQCVMGHEPTNANKPGSGAGKWKKMRLMAPTDEDGNMNTKHWDRVPDAPKTHIAVWHGNRLIARNDTGIGGKQTLLYSRLAKVADPDNVGKKRIGRAGNPQWDPDDWRTGGEDGAGFVPFETQKGDPITAVASFGYYALVFKRYSTHVIAGLNPATWTIRQLADVGTTYAKAFCEVAGWLYFITDRGFFRTDGTQVTPVPGAEKVDQWLRDSINWSADLKDIELKGYDGQVWMTLPTDNESGINNKVLVYDPPTESFWPQALEVQTMAVARRDGRDRLFFATPTKEGTTTLATYGWTGAMNGSTSSRTIGGVTLTNYITNPNFGNTTQWGNPTGWANHGPFVKLRATKAAARRGKYGMEIQNKVPAGTGLDISNNFGYMGATHTPAPPAGAYVFQITARRAGWIKQPHRKPPIKFKLGNAVLDPAGFKYLGEGWYKIWVAMNFAGGESLQVLTAPNTTTHVDTAILTTGAGPVDYFDGNGGEIAGDAHLTGNQRPYILQYDHEDSIDTDGNVTDDDLAAVAGTVAVNWFGRTSWLTFGALQEERRIRRLWALVRANEADVGLRTFRNFQGEDDGSNISTVTPSDGVVYNEGALPEDCHSIQVEVEGSEAPAALLGIALDTEPRRIRFGRR